MRLDTEIKVAVGCVNYLIEEIETLRKRTRELQIENDAYNRIIKMTESIHPKNNLVGYGEDRLWQAKKEIEEAINKKKLEDSDVKPVKVE